MSRRSFFRLCGLLLQILALALGTVALLASSLATAWVVDSPTVFIAVGILTCFCVSFVLTYFSLKLMGQSHRRFIPLLISVAATSVIAVGVGFLFLTPLVPREEQFAIEVPSDVELWTLSTGSEIAVRRILAKEKRHPYPIVFLHGGPGAYSVSMAPTVQAISRFADDGHDVYFYDQIGGGISARLKDISEYALDRHLDDLDAIYQRINSGKIILIGSSGGATLGANYMARNPAHVAAAIFSGAGPIYYPHWKDKSDGGLDQRLSTTQRKALADMIETPRLFAALALAEINPKAAAKFASDAELGSLFDKVANEFYLPLAVCSLDGIKATSAGYGFWSNRMTGKTLKNRKNDPRPTLRRNSTPVLVLRGDCDYKSEAVAAEYVDVFPNSRFGNFENAGHMLYWEQPDDYVFRVRQFLAEAADPRI